jgi:hypothetical protein
MNTILTQPMDTILTYTASEHDPHTAYGHDRQVENLYRYKNKIK